MRVGIPISLKLTYVVRDRRLDYGFGVRTIIRITYNHLLIPGMRELVGREVVDEALDQSFRQILHFSNTSVDRIVLKDGEDLVIGFTAIEHRQSAHYPGVEQDLGARDMPLAKHADVEGIEVPACCARHQGGDGWAGVRLRNEPVD